MFPFRHNYVRSVKLMLILVSACLCFALFKYLQFKKTICTQGQVHTTINTLCSEYNSGLLQGNLCEDICSKHLLRPLEDSCTTFHYEKDVVFSGNYNGKLVFVKSRRASILSEPYEGSPVFKSDIGVYPTLIEYEQHVRDYLTTWGWEQERIPNVLEKLWAEPFIPKEKHGDLSFLSSSMDSLWHLIMNNEYVISKLFPDVELFPKIVGSCGGFSVSEMVSPISMPRLVEPSLSKILWTERLKQALQIVDMVDRMKVSFYKPLAICDVKNAHFGMSSEGKMLYIDAGAAHINYSAVRATLTSGRCDKGQSCNWVDCKGSCNHETGFCTEEIKNSNIQIVCNKVFLKGDPIINWSHRNGLLKSSLTPTHLLDLLERCASSTHQEQDQISRSLIELQNTGSITKINNDFKLPRIKPCPSCAFK